MQTGSVQIHVPVLNVWVLAGHLCTTRQEQSVGSSHDVGLVHSCHGFTTSRAGIVECKLCHSHGGFVSDELDALYHTVYNLCVCGNDVKIDKHTHYH